MENIKGLPVVCPTENNIVKKAEQLIASRYSLNVFEIKIISKLIAMIKISDTYLRQYAFRVEDWRNEQDLKRKDIYKAFEDLADSLLSKPLTIRQQNGDWLKMNWVSSARYKKGEGTVIFKISDELKPYLLELKNHFLQYDIKNILPLKSSYSIRLYELLKDWYVIGTRYRRVNFKSRTVAKVVELEWLRQTFQVPKKYKYGDIKRRILDKARKDLKKHTDITFSFEEFKESRKVSLIKFFINKAQKSATQKKLVYTSDTIRQTAIAMLALLPGKYRTAAAEKMLLKYHSKGVEYIKAQTEYTSNAEPENYLAYLRNALQGDFAGVQKSGLTADIKAKQNQESSEQKRARQEREQEEQRRKQKEEEEIRRLEDFYVKMPQNERDRIRTEALLRLHEKHPDAAANSPTFGELSVEITIKRILKERLDR